MTPFRTVAPGYYKYIFHDMVNLRLLHVDVNRNYLLLEIPSSAYSLWNLQTLYLSATSRYHTCSILEIWRMPLLRHVVGTQNQTLDGACCTSPFDKDEVVLPNLQTLFIVRNLKCVDRVLAMIPNIKKLKLEYDGKEEEGDYCLYNLHRLHKLRILSVRASYPSTSVPFMRELTLPYSLKKLTLGNTKLPWEDMASKIGCLPLLQLLKLKRYAFVGSEWETVEGQFSSLKFLEIKKCRGLECWTTDSTHFPRLEHLLLRGVSSLREIPSSIGDIPTLRSIRLETWCGSNCSDSVQRGVVLRK